MNIVIDLLCGAAGFALCWFTKDYTVTLVLGAESFAQKLEAQAKAVRAAL